MNKKLLAIVGGAGVAAGVLMAPDKGSRTIKKLSAKGKKIIDSAKKAASGEIGAVKDSIRSKVDEVKTAIRSKARAAADKTLAAEDRMHRKLRDAIRTVGKATGGPQKKTTVREMKSVGVSRNGAAKKAASAKPSRLKKAISARAAASNGMAGKSSNHRANGRSSAKRSSR